MPPSASSANREALTARSIPHMALSLGDASSMTGPPPPMPYYLSSEGRAARRFAIEGNAIRMLKVSRVLGLVVPRNHPSPIKLTSSASK